jgi:hypothetical protein
MINIMKMNQSLPYLQVADIIAAEVKVSLTEARGAYRYFVRQGMAPGVVDTLIKARATKKQVTKKTATITAAVDAGLIKASNLEKIRQVSLARSESHKARYGSRVSQAVEIEDPEFDADAARDEVERMLEERDDIKNIVPRFLHKELGLI